MVIIDTTISNFDTYLNSLSHKARKELRRVIRSNLNVTYSNVEFNEKLVHGFMELWQEQPIRGKRIEWAFGIEHVKDINDQGRLLVFCAYEEAKPIACHFIEKQIGFWDCHPPMYKKSLYSDQSLAKFMWLSLIRFAMNNQLGILNLGGGIDRWREMIVRRNEFPNPKYKWLYVSENIKNFPMLEPDYIIESDGERKKLLRKYD